MAISENNKYALILTVQKDSAQIQQGTPRLYCVDLSPPAYPIRWTADVAGSDWGATADRLATLGNYCVASSGSFAYGSPVGATFTIDAAGPINTPLDTLGFLSDDVAAAYVAGVPVGILNTDVWGVLAKDLTNTTGGYIPTGQGAPYFGTYPPLWPVVTTQFGVPDWTSDSIAIGSSHYIAIANRDFQATWWEREGYVGISDFTGGASERTFGFTCPPTQVLNHVAMHPLEYLHDVTVTPNGLLGVVSGNGVFGVYDMVNVGVVDSVVSHADLPHMQLLNPSWKCFTADSVEATNTRAIIIGKDIYNDSSQEQAWFAASQTAVDSARWRITLVDLDVSVSPLPRYTYNDPTPPNPSIVPSRAHDVAITPGGDYAVVSTRYQTLVFDMNATISSALQRTYLLDTDPLSFHWANPTGALVTNSVAVTNQYAVIVGRSAATSRARISLIDLFNPDVNQYWTFDIGLTPQGGQLSPWELPTDVRLSSDGQFAVIRISDDSYPFVGAGNNVFGRIVVVSLRSKSVVLGQASASPPFPANIGSGQGSNQIACNSQYAVTAGWDMNKYAAPGGTIPQAGWFQIVKLK